MALPAQLRQTGPLEPPSRPAPPAPEEPSTGWPETTQPAVQLARGAYLQWLLGSHEDREANPGAAEAIVAAVDHALHTPEIRARLLRRAPNVVPKLMETLRSEAYSRKDVAQQIQRDVVLTAEVLRTVRSPLYAHHVRGAPSVAKAVDLLGTSGLKQVITKVLTRPLYTAQRGSLQARAAARLWEESDRCARLCVALAEGTGLDPVDTYLGGLLHNVGWGAMLAAIDTAGAAPHLHAALMDTPEFVQALFERRDRLLAELMPTWGISDSLSAMALALGGTRTCEAPPLLKIVLHAQELVVLRRLQETGDMPGGIAVPPGCPPSVACVYLAP